MILKPYSFAGTSLQSTDFDTSIPRDSAALQMQADPYYIKRAGAVSVYAGKDFKPVTINLEILCLHDFMTLFESVNTLFDTKDETPRQFICQDTEDTSAENPKQYYVYATPKQVQGGHEGNMAVVTLALDDPIWQSVTQNSQTFTTTDASDSTSVTNNGNDYAYPIFEITPTSQGGGYLYNMFCQVLPTSTDSWTSRPVDIVGTTDGTTWDTAALIATGKVQASSDPGGAGGDIRVYRDGVEVDFFLTGVNSTDTGVWVVADMPSAADMTLKTAIASTDTVTEIQLKYTTANKQKIANLPASGRLIVDTTRGSTDTEEFTYTAKTVTATKLAFTINSRAVRNTTAANHGTSSFVRFLPYDFNILYGNVTVDAPTIDTNKQPIIDITSSTNASFVYSNFWSETPRAGIWAKKISRVTNVSLSRSDFFTSTNDVADVDPATEMGIKALTFESAGVWKRDTVEFAWSNYFPDVVASFSASGDQMQNVLATPAFTAKSSTRPGSYTILWTVAKQSTSQYGTWTTWSKASSDATVPANTKWLHFYLAGTVGAAAPATTDSERAVGVSAVTVNFSHAPHVMTRGEQTNFNLDMRLSNPTSSDSFDIFCAMDVNQTLYIDTDPDFPTVKYKGQIINGAIKLDTIRAAWMRLIPGANTITYSSNSGASDITFVIKWRDRMNFL